MDLHSIVEAVSGIPSKEFSKLLKDSENFTILCNTGTGTLRQVDVERLASSLPLHLIAVLLSPDTEKCLAHLLHGVRLLHTLAETASRHTRLEQILLDDVKISEQLIDLVFFMLIVLTQTEQDYGHGTSLPALHLTLVASTLHLLKDYISSQWHELVHVLLAHPKVDIFMDVAFDAVHADIRLLQIKLSALSNDIFSGSCSLPAAERTSNYLCQQCEASLQFLLSLCQQKTFRDRLLKNKELCKNGGFLSLSLTILKLKVSDGFKDSFSVVAALSRLKAKILSILLQLCEAESISYLDEVAGSPKSMHLAKAVVLEILDLLKAAFRKDTKQVGSLDQSNPKGLVLLNSLRLADIYSDDSNFRSFFMINAIQAVIELLAISHDEFQASWCSPDIPMTEEDANLEYDPFTAAGIALIFITPDHDNALSASVPLNENSYSCNNNFNGMLTVTYAQQRTSYLVKIIANLHCFVPNICGEEERNLFLNQFHECLRMGTPELSSYSSNSKAHKTARICENLGSLSDHAATLTASLLNDEDVQLLRGFTEQLKKLITPQIGDNMNQELFVKDAEGKPRKVEDPSLMQQAPLDWTTFSNANYNNARKDTQYTCGAAASALKRLNDIESGGRPESSMCPELDQRVSTSNPADMSNPFELDESKTKMFVLTSRLVAEQLISIEKENQNLETKVLDPKLVKGDLDLISDVGEFHRAAEYVKENSFQDYEKVEGVQGEEKQPRKRKRNIMSEKQINMIEKVLVDEPEMQRNFALLQSWADKLSAQGSEITPSQLKNWLNNRKAKLARAAREVRASSEGENANPDKSCAPSTSQLYDSPDSAGDDPYITSTRTSSIGTRSAHKSAKSSGGEEHDTIPHSVFANIQSNHPLRAVDLKPGQSVMVVDGEGHEVGRGKVFQVEGRWQGKNMEDIGVCIVDVTEIKVDCWKEVLYPSDGDGRTFEEAAARNSGVARVAWAVGKVCQLPK